jgi:hypothetical protein
MRFLSLILFLPTFAILLWIYWKFPRGLPVTRRRRLFDGVASVVALVSAIVAVAWAISPEEAVLGSTKVANQYGPLWPQILAVLAAWHVFPILLGVAWFIRGRLFGSRSGEFTRD